MNSDTHSIVKLTNLLNFTRQDFDVLGQRLMVLIFEKLKTMQSFNATQTAIELSFNFVDFQETNIERIKELADKVTSKKVFFEVTPDEWVYIVPIYYASYRKGVFTIKIAPEVSKYFLDIAGYTNLDKKAVFALSSQYSIRMYELLSAFIKKGEWTIDVLRLKQYLAVDNKYKNFVTFRTYILEYCQKELWEHCGIHFTWEIAAKQRKKITALTFHISSKDKQEKVELSNEIKQTVDYINNLKPIEIAQKVQMASAKYTLAPEQIDYIISDNKIFNEFIRIDLIIEAMIEKQNPPKDRTKYLAKSLGLDKVKFNKK